MEKTFVKGRAASVTHVGISCTTISHLQIDQPASVPEWTETENAIFVPTYQAYSGKKVRGPKVFLLQKM
jgi:hypothetical protein